jgi:multidrug efflux system membrane fusion protein
MNLKSYLIAASIALVLGVWMLSGLFDGSDAPAQDAAESEPAARMDVRVTTLSSESVDRFLESQGDTQAERDVRLRAETEGRVIEVLAEEGDTVDAGDLILRLDLADREAQLAEAKARVAQRTADFQAAQRLQGEGFQSEIAVNEAEAALETARAQLSSIEEDIANTRITAPVSGVVERRSVDEGDYLAVGEDVARLLDADPMIAVADIAQQDIGKVRLGTEAEIELATGDTLTGQVRYISGAAESGARTFRVEVAAPNPDGLPVGVSATVRIPQPSVEAVFLSPAWLSLEESGEVGVKVVNADDAVVFHAVDIVRADRDGVYVTGLPDAPRVITVGQGFVRNGERVNAVPRDEATPETDAEAARQAPMTSGGN